MEVGAGDGIGEGDGGYLSESMDSRVGAARPLGQGGFAGDVVNGAGECALNGGEIGLDLPAVVGGSIVSESELPVGHGADLDGITRECLTPMSTDDAD